MTDPELIEVNPLRCNDGDPTWRIRGGRTRQELTTRNEVADLGNVHSRLIQEIVNLLQSVPDKLMYLGREQKEIRSHIGTLPEERRSLRFFDPVSGVSLQDEPSEEEARWDQNDIEEWVPFIERTGAFKKNLCIGMCT